MLFIGVCAGLTRRQLPARVTQQRFPQHALHRVRCLLFCLVWLWTRRGPNMQLLL